MRLIDADELKDSLDNGSIVIDEEILGCDNVHEILVYLLQKVEAAVKEKIDEQPTVNAPEKTGKWRLHINGSGTCDQCGITQIAVWDYDNWQNYCGHCGAKMIGVEGWEEMSI